MAHSQPLNRNTAVSRRYLLDNEGLLARLMLIPSLVYILALVGIPFVMAILFAFSDVTIADQSIDLVGLRTFERAIQDPAFRISLKNTFIFTIGSQLTIIVLANILALTLMQSFRFKWLFRFLIVLPWTTPIALGTIGWLWMLDSVYSPLDWMLRQLGVLGLQGHVSTDPNMYYLGKVSLARLSIIAVQVWRILPLSTIILLAGHSSIPTDIKDAVKVDGIGPIREFFEVTIPLMYPILLVSTLFGTIFIFTDMTVVYVLTRGNPPPNSTQVLSSWAYTKGVQSGDLAQGAAIAIFLFPLLLAVTIGMLRTASRMEVR